MGPCLEHSNERIRRLSLASRHSSVVQFLRVGSQAGSIGYSDEHVGMHLRRPACAVAHIGNKVDGNTVIRMLNGTLLITIVPVDRSPGQWVEPR